MTLTNKLDPQGIVRAVDAEVNFNRRTYGAEDLDQSDYLRVTGNDTLRQIIMRARNDGETGDILPLIASCIPDFASCITDFDDFTSLPTAAYTATQATAGTFALASLAGGVALADCNSTTADQGINVQRVAGAFSLAAGVLTYFGCRVKVTDTIDKCQSFCGLSIIDTTIIGSGEITASDFVGFLSDATKLGGVDTGKLDLEWYDGVAAERISNAATLVEDTWTVLEFVIDGVGTIYAYQDGVLTGTATIVDAPDGVMAPSFVCQSEGTNDPILSIDWFRVFQTRH